MDSSPHVSRRTLAWTAPVVVAVAAAPRIAASPACGSYTPTTQVLPLDISSQDGPQTLGQRLSFSGYLPAGSTWQVSLQFHSSDATDTVPAPQVDAVAGGTRPFGDLFSTAVGSTTAVDASEATGMADTVFLSTIVTVTALVDIYPGDGPVSATITQGRPAHTLDQGWTYSSTFAFDVPQGATVKDDSTCTEVTVTVDGSGSSSG